ncbi:MAG: hypothetical protein EBX40_08760 [Gammaproteobacteria bacterium]|nr:hypothetical protein [Gammaproteobacteria bacterium]
MDLKLLRQFIRLTLAESDFQTLENRKIKEASSVSGGALGSMQGPEVAGINSNESDADSLTAGKVQFNPDKLSGDCPSLIDCEDAENTKNESKRVRRVNIEASGVAALGGGPAMPLGASAQYPAQSVGVASYVRPKRSRKRRSRSRKTR